MLMLCWGFAAVAGFVAGALAAPSLFLSPIMMFSVVIYSLAAAALGGWDSPAGAIVGGLVLVWPKVSARPTSKPSAPICVSPFLCCS